MKGESSDPRSRERMGDISSKRYSLVRVPEEPSFLRYDINMKIMVIGASNVGKTTIVDSFISEGKPSHTQPTIGIDFKNVILRNEEKHIKLQIYDTAGQERFRSVVKAYYKNCNECVVVYDTTNPESFETANYLVEEFRTFNPQSQGNISLLGNKTDQPNLRAIPLSVAAQYARTVGVKYYECSGLKYLGVTEVFYDIAIKALKQIPVDLTMLNTPTNSFEHPTNQKLEVETFPVHQKLSPTRTPKCQLCKNNMKNICAIF